jgi:hypothetical protein
VRRDEERIDKVKKKGNRDGEVVEGKRKKKKKKEKWWKGFEHVRIEGGKKKREMGEGV